MAMYIERAASVEKSSGKYCNMEKNTSKKLKNKQAAGKREKIHHLEKPRFINR